ncbi:hypothetical protein AVEN_179472-1 [Araneus ventricosus]|uniref:Uncharacterized protein n=1 Tax=Araneus ventricosus TaxID=182803 RepID=A0A4Y2BE69_ARAVE|nr:hypothetical protein AVEN_179472-1 [Araneus ventricosus]
MGSLCLNSARCFTILLRCLHDIVQHLCANKMVMWKFGEEELTQMSSFSSDHDLKLRYPSSNNLYVVSKRDTNLINQPAKLTPFLGVSRPFDDISVMVGNTLPHINRNSKY